MSENERYEPMPWCPGCSYEHNSRKKKCPECGMPLGKGPGLNAPIPYLNRNWFTVRIVDDSVQAEMLRNFLESNGYEVAVRNGNGFDEGRSAGSQNGHLEEQILVPVESASQAARLLRAGGEWSAMDHRGCSDDDGEEEDEFELQADAQEFLKSNGFTGSLDYDEFMY